MRSIHVDVKLLHIDDWEIELPIVLGLGQLETVRDDVLRFFAFAL
jgi:hypothetical protein